MGKTASEWQAFAKRLIARGGSDISWTRRFLSGGAAGVVTETLPAQTIAVRAAQTEISQRALVSAEIWEQTQVTIVIASDALAGLADPSVRYEDQVQWLGRAMRVLATRQWTAPGGAAGPAVVATFVWLGG